MKKLVIVFILLLLTVGVFAQELALDEAIERAARNIETEMPQRALILVLNVASPSEDFSRYVLDELTDHLVIGRKITVVDRQNLAAIRAETNFQYSGEVSDESMVSIGKMLGAHYIVTGSLNQRGTNYRLRFRIIGVETTRIISSVILDIKNDAQVARLIGGERAVQEAEQKQREIEEKEKANRPANVKNNWLSADLSYGYYWGRRQGLTFGARYERMLNSNISLGLNFYGLMPFFDDFYGIKNPPDPALTFGIDASFRVYTFGKKFFLGLALGYHEHGNQVIVEGANNDPSLSGTRYGLGITVELGWKIDVGKEGGFFLQPGLSGTFITGKFKDIRSYDLLGFNEEDIKSYESDFDGHARIYLGVGWAF